MTTDGRARSPLGPRYLVAAGSSVAEGVAFWTATALPFVSLLVIVAPGGSRVDLAPIVGLLAVNAVALVVGHGHEPVASKRTDAEGQGATRNPDRSGASEA